MGKHVTNWIAKFPDLPKAIRDLSALAPDYEGKKAEFKEYYAINFPTLLLAEKTVRNLVQLLLSDLEISEAKVSSRIKDRDEALQKFELKYRDQLERDGKDYKIHEHISDLIGIRVVCLYEPDIDAVAALLRKEFEVLGETNKTEVLLKDISSFGYKGHHFDVKLNSARLEYSEYQKIGPTKFEVQIRTIAQNAWSEIDHKLKYKRQINDRLQRRIVRLAALFELADQEFVAIRNETTELEKVATKQASDAIQQDPNRPLDAFSFLTFMQTRYPFYTFDSVRIDGFVDELKRISPELMSGELEELVELGAQAIKPFKEFTALNGIKMNPFTEIRHMLYAAKPSIFDPLLYPNQRNTFLRWFEDHIKK